MADNLKLWERLKKMPGGDRNPFDTPVGPTYRCLTSSEVASFVGNGENNEDINLHLDECGACRDRIARFKAVR